MELDNIMLIGDLNLNIKLKKKQLLKQKQVRGNQSPFMTKELSKAIMGRPKSKYNK